jgi:hypothetical protein
MEVMYQMRSFKENDLPRPTVIILLDCLPKQSFSASIKGFPMPSNSQEAIQFALQSINHFFEHCVGEAGYPTFDTAMLEHRRKARHEFNELMKQDLSYIPLKILPDRHFIRTQGGWK